MCYGYQNWSEESLMQDNDDYLHGGQRSADVKCGKLCTMVTKRGQKNPGCKFVMMMMITFMEVKCHQSSNMVHCALYLSYQTWSEEFLMQVYDDNDDLHGGQRSSEVKCGKLCAMVTKLGKFMMI